jgi:hypothetical protein
MEAHIIVNQKFTNLWQDRLGYPGSTMMQKLVEKNGYIVKSQKILQSSNYRVLLAPGKS